MLGRMAWAVVESARLLIEDPSMGAERKPRRGCKRPWWLGASLWGAGVCGAALLLGNLLGWRRAVDASYSVFDACVAARPHRNATRPDTWLESKLTEAWESPARRLGGTPPLVPAPAPGALRVYVYDVPERYTQDLLDRRVDLASTSYAELQKLPSGGLELVVHKWLLHDAPQGVVVREPARANMFFVPFYSAAMWSSVKHAKTGLFQRLIGEIRAQGPWWDRLNGADHVFALGRQYSERTAVGIGTNDLARSFQTVFLLFEFTNHDPEELRQRLWRFARNVVVPRPDPFEGRYPLPHPDLSRPFLAAYVGSQVTRFRRDMVSAMRAQASEEGGVPVYLDAFCRNDRLSRAEAMQAGTDEASQVAAAYRASDFCPCPRGDSRTDSRFFDAIRAGCIPVMFDRVRVMPFASVVRYESFVVYAEEVRSYHSLLALMRKLRDMPLRERARRRRYMAQVTPVLSFTKESPSAFDAIANELAGRANVLATFRQTAGEGADKPRQ